MAKSKYKVVLETSPEDAPKDYEVSAALILAYHFKSDVVFLRPETKKTPDILVGDTKWEIKSPRGDGKKTIDNNLRTARKQSQNIVLDLRRAKIHQLKAISRINQYLLAGPHTIKHIKVITKAQNVIDIL